MSILARLTTLEKAVALPRQDEFGPEVRARIAAIFADIDTSPYAGITCTGSIADSTLLCPSSIHPKAAKPDATTSPA